ncbi:MAG: hypothetical protein WC796_02960 [Candidatus Pacearchaeota archaeon]|jgi:hypothetical protein
METDRKPLYDDGQVKIETHLTPEDHLISFNDERVYVLQRGCLKEVALAPYPNSVEMLGRLCQGLRGTLLGEKVHMGDLVSAVCKAYIEGERRADEDLLALTADYRGE